MIIHFGMSGLLRIFNSYIPPEKHDHIDIFLDDGTLLRYNDVRRFGFLLWAKNISKHPLIFNLGPEPLNDEFNASYFYTKAKSSRRAIKPLLMDSKLVAGIGNIYSNESLFEAKIHPDRLSYSLSFLECTILVGSIKKVLSKSIEKGGSSVKNFIDSNGNIGKFSKEFWVYSRNKKPCKVCGKPITLKKHASRTTFYCQYCQK